MRTLRSALVALALSLVAAPAFAQGFLKIDGVDGESTDDKHKGEIEIQSVTTQEGPATERKVRVHDILITKKMDKSSPTLFRLATKGEPLPGTVTVVLDSPKQPANPKEPREYLKIELHDVLISSVRAEPRSGVETVALNARSFEVYSRAGLLGPWVKRDAAAMSREHPSIFQPPRAR